ncbi:MAG: phosphotransferase family protein [Acidimicrobiales bacterium]
MTDFEVPDPGRVGPLVGSGRSADVYQYGADHVLRRFRTNEPQDPRVQELVKREAEVMIYARSHGFPVPQVVAQEGTDMVMEFVHGPTMLDRVGSRPWEIGALPRILARLHEQLSHIPAPPGMPRPFGPGDALLHLDLHPGNVMMTQAGPMVIDWTNAGAGPPGADVAQTWLIMATSQLPGNWLNRAVAGAGRGLFLRRFLGAVASDEARAVMALVAAVRRLDPNVTVLEQDRIDKMLVRFEPVPA